MRTLLVLAAILALSCLTPASSAVAVTPPYPGIVDGGIGHVVVHVDEDTCIDSENPTSTWCGPLQN